MELIELRRFFFCDMHKESPGMGDPLTLWRNSFLSILCHAIVNFLVGITHIFGAVNSPAKYGSIYAYYS